MNNEARLDPDLHALLEREWRLILTLLLSRLGGEQVITSEDLMEAYEGCNGLAAIVLEDNHLMLKVLYPGEDGHQVVREILERIPEHPSPTKKFSH